MKIQVKPPIANTRTEIPKPSVHPASCCAAALMKPTNASVGDVLEYLTKTLAGRDFSGFLDILVPWSAS